MVLNITLSIALFRNMVAMITGAKRYILAPPNQCTSLGIVTDKRHPVYRHSILNFGHLNILGGHNKKAEDVSLLKLMTLLKCSKDDLNFLFLLH